MVRLVPHDEPGDDGIALLCRSSWRAGRSGLSGGPVGSPISTLAVLVRRRDDLKAAFVRRGFEVIELEDLRRTGG